MLSRYKFLAIGAAFLTLAACKDEENRQETAASSSAPVVQAIKAVPHEIPLSFESVSYTHLTLPTTPYV